MEAVFLWILMINVRKNVIIIALIAIISGSSVVMAAVTEFQLTINSSQTRERADICGISAGVFKAINFTDRTTPLKKLRFKPKNAIPCLAFHAEEFTDKPDTIVRAPSGTTYKFLRFRFSSNSQYLDNDDIEFEEDVEITFDVERTWLAENNIDQNNVVLERYSETTEEWTSLTTTLVDNNEELTIEYMALSPGFSYFVVSEEEVPETPPVIRFGSPLPFYLYPIEIPIYPELEEEEPIIPEEVPPIIPEELPEEVVPAEEVVEEKVIEEKIPRELIPEEFIPISRDLIPKEIIERIIEEIELIYEPEELPVIPVVSVKSFLLSLHLPTEYQEILPGQEFNIYNYIIYSGFEDAYPVLLSYKVIGPDDEIITSQELEVGLAKDLVIILPIKVSSLALPGKYKIYIESELDQIFSSAEAYFFVIEEEELIIEKEVIEPKLVKKPIIMWAAVFLIGFLIILGIWKQKTRE